MNTTKITLKSAVPMTQDTSEAMAGERTVNDANPFVPFGMPTMSSKQKVVIPPFRTNAGPGARCKVSSLTPYGEKLDTLAVRALPEILGVSDVGANTPGKITRALLEQAIAASFGTKDIGRCHQHGRRS